MYEGEFSITLTIALPPVVATCAGDVTFVVDEESICISEQVHAHLMKMVVWHRTLIGSLG